MKKLHIENIGPLHTVDIQLRKLNLIIAPQSAGKSCILKIASFCAWLEKTIELDRRPDVFVTRKFIDESLITFHNLQGYVRNNSSFAYETNTMKFSFSFKDDSFKFEWKNGRWGFKRTKIAYIVAERNILSVVPNWLDLTLPKNSLLNYMKEWQNARNYMKGKEAIPILNIGVVYDYDSQSGTDEIVLDGGKKLAIRNASSGLQSLVPLYVLIDFMTKGIFLTDMKSVKDQDISIHLLDQLQKEHPTGKSIHFDGQSFTIGSDDAKEIVENFTKYDHSDIYLEEPEENLFPETQHDLVNWLADLLNGERDHTLFIATHSPYIMSAFNNLIQAGDIIEESPEKQTEVERIIGGKRSISYDDVAAFAISDRTVHSIKDDELRLISPSELDTASDNISDVFNQLVQL